ncbi:MAG: hypothetical protein JWO91_3830 [Acidobacteriaceae bacterium]|jgi:hypothetical protein|nr:hypothetical protein [Acidobacteriaceae bacterium]
MAQSVAVTGIPSHTDLASIPVMESAIERPGFSLKPSSRLRGRERWHVGGLRGNTRLAAAVEVALRGELGVEEAVANPVTGRVLVRFSPDRIHAPVEVLIRKAIELDTVTEREFSRPIRSRPFLLPKRLLAAELGCSLFKVLLFGGISCSLGGLLLAAGVIVSLGLAGQHSV